MNDRTALKLTRMSNLLISFVRRYWALSLILLLAATFRFAYLTTNPPGVYYDELVPFAQALDLLRAQGLYYPGSETIFSTIIRAVFGEYESLLLVGPSTLAIRLPGATYGTALVLISYMLASTLFNRTIALWTALFMAISPLAVQSSRAFYGAENVVPLFLLVLATYLALSALRSVPWRSGRIVAASALLGSVAGYYFTVYGRLTAILVGFLLLVYAIRIGWKNKRARWFQDAMLYALAAFGSVVILVPLLLGQGAVTAASQGSLTFGPDNLIISKGLINGGWVFLTRYVAYFSPQFLFITGDSNPSTNTGLTGEYLLPSIFYFYLGCAIIGYLVYRRKTRSFGLILIGAWLLSAPVEASLYVYNATPSSFAALFLDPSFAIVTAIGVVCSISWLTSATGNAMERQGLSRLRSHIDWQRLLYVESSNITQPADLSQPAPLTLEVVGSSENRGTRTGGLRYAKWFGRHTSSTRQTVLSTLVVCLYLGTFLGMFVPAYFVTHPDSVVNNPETQWGEFFGFPQVGEYIGAKGLTAEPVYIDPTDLFSNNLSQFNYWYYVTKTPQNYLDFYSGGKTLSVTVLSNSSQLYCESQCLVLSGSSSLVETLRQNGLNATNLTVVQRPNGNVAMVLAQVEPGLLPGALNQLRDSLVFSTGGIGVPTTFEVPALNRTFSNLTVGVSITSGTLGCVPSGKYEAINNNESPAFTIGLLGVSGSSADCPNERYVEFGTMYSVNTNYSIPGSWSLLTSTETLASNGSYQMFLEYTRGACLLFLNGTEVASSTLAYPLWPLSSLVTIDALGGTFVKAAGIWNATLTPAQMDYLAS
jgi:hypothetical protein